MHSTAGPRPVGTAVPEPAAPVPAGSRGSWVRRQADPLTRLLGAAAAGGLLVAAFPPYGIWPLAVLSVAAFALLTRDVRARRGAWVGMVYGLAFFVPLLSWTGIYVGPVPWLILATAEAVFLAALGAGLAVTARLRGWPLWGAALWVAQEAARDRGPFGGFPWGRLAFAQAESPLVWLAAYGGAPLVTFAVALAGSLLAARALALAGRGPASWLRPATPAGPPTGPARPDRVPEADGQPRTGPAPRTGAGLPTGPGLRTGSGLQTGAGLRTGRRARAAVPALTGILALAGATAAATAAGDWQTSRTRPYAVAIVQGNVPRLGLDFNAQREAVLRNHVTATLQLAADAAAGRVAKPDLVLWPENASDIDPIRNADAYALIDRAAKAVGVPILVGTLADGPTPTTIRNVAYVWDPRTGPGESYVKRHPVPFAEYIPLRKIARMVSKDVDLVQRDFVPGDRAGNLTVGPATVGDVICFEVAYDGLIHDVAQDSEMIVVQTNNATFGRSNETWQQLAMGRLRAVEHGRPVLVAATSGVSAVIAPDGHLQGRSDVFTPDVLVRTVSGRQGSTLAGRVGAGPEWAVVAIALAGLALAAVGRRRTRDQAVVGTKENR
jgi:apolipoprotein N-acyltransferase